MNINRAEEIINSKGVIKVTYNNSPIWIENVRRDDSTAQVKLLENNQSISVPVEYLSEVNESGKF